MIKDHFKNLQKVLVITLFLSTNLFVSNAQNSLRINEFMALNNTTITDEDGIYSDWLEIYNPTAYDINLSGWSLTDDKQDTYQWSFPEMVIGPGECLLIFASGKNRAIAGEELHTNFRLSGDGEYLALIDPFGEAVTEFDPAFPVQQADISYGYYEEIYTGISNPTPGTIAPGEVTAMLPAPVFDKDHGFYNSTFNLGISCELEEAEIYYTTDGSAPSTTNGDLYTEPVTISTTSIIRAIATLPDHEPSKPTTRTFLFLDDVLNQPDSIPGYPGEWGPYTAIDGQMQADYEMDPEMLSDPDFATTVKDALLDIPTISLVSDKEHFFAHDEDSETGGIYIYTGAPLGITSFGPGRGWERPASMEFFDTDGNHSLQVDCGMRLQGGHSRRHEKSPKHSFLILFKGEYGPTRLDYPFFGEDSNTDHNKLILRAEFGNSWIHHGHHERVRGTYQRDIWGKDTQRDMGHPSSNSIHAHLYINGIYWGLYAPSERMDNDFGAAYLEGEREDFDVIKDYTEVADGNINAWNEMMAQAENGLETTEAYQKIQGNNPDGTNNPEYEALVDVVNLADYMLLNFYGSNTDWDHHNWAAMRNRVKPGKGFKFFSWDGEHLIKSVHGNELNENNEDCPSGLFQQLMENEEYQRLFANRVQKHCFNGGALTPEASSGRWMERREIIKEAVNAEAVRWGDYRRDKHQFQTSGPFDLYDKENYWLPQQDFMLNTYFPQRTGVFIDQLRNAGMFPEVDAPEIQINDNPLTGRYISKGDVLSMNTDEGVIYYTTDGSDPADWDSQDHEASSAAEFYSEAMELNNSMHIKARVLHEDQWSAMTDHYFIIPENFYDLKITEINYHPHDEDTIDGNNFEFLEIKNTGESTLDLGGLQFTDGIDYTFPPNTQLEGGDFILLASNTQHFYDRYNFMPFDEYAGQLANDGEKIEMVSVTADTICSFRYNDNEPWPQSADGPGKSLVPTEFNPDNDQDSSIYWRASHEAGGSPGADDIDGIHYLDGGYTPIDEPISEAVPDDGGNELDQNYPNPFVNETHIHYKLTEGAHVSLTVYNMTGQKITILVDRYQQSGTHLVKWKAGTKNSRVAEGVYFYRIMINSGNETHSMTRKMIKTRSR